MSKVVQWAGAWAFQEYIPGHMCLKRFYFFMQVKTYEKIQRAIELSVAARANTPLTQKGRQIIANIYTR